MNIATRRTVVHVALCTLALPMCADSAQAAPAGGPALHVGLIPSNPGPYVGGEVIAVDVVVTERNGTLIELLTLQFDFRASSENLPLPPVFQWNISPAFGVPAMPVPTWQGGPPPVLVPFASMLAGRLIVNLPNAPGCYTLDALNASDPVTGARISAIPNGLLTAFDGDIIGEWLQFDVNSANATELCNKYDDNCNGLIDEGYLMPAMDPTTTDIIFVGAGAPCFIGEGICEAQGHWECSEDGDKLVCIPDEDNPPPQQEGPYLDETCCNWRDDDCDGLVDTEDPECQGPEVCDGCDNDFDGAVDEDFPQLGAACVVGEHACQREGVWVCAPGGGVRCSVDPLPAIPEGPIDGYRCGDGLDNDCDGLVDINDPDCQQPERCDQRDNDGDGEKDEDFSDLGDGCIVGQGPCARIGRMVCRADGSGTVCNAAPGPPGNEGPAGCDCADGIDNDCDGLVDVDDPDCGSSSMRVRAALPTLCNGRPATCRSRHIVDYEVINEAPGTEVTAELLAIDAAGQVVESHTVFAGEIVYIEPEGIGGPDIYDDDLTLDLDFHQLFSDCMQGPGEIVTDPQCSTADFNCDRYVDVRDYSVWQSLFGESTSFLVVEAASPTLHVSADNGRFRTDAYQTPAVVVRGWNPKEKVVVVNRRDRTFVEMQLQNVDLATLHLKIDGQSVFDALRIDPGAAFPGGPYGGPVTLPNGCTAEICQLVVDTADTDAMSANTLSMYVDGMCGGGHIVVATAEPADQAPPPDECAAGALRGESISHGFEMVVDTPTPGTNDPAPPTTVAGRVLHGRPLPQLGNDVFIRIRGQDHVITEFDEILGDGEDSATTYVYPFEFPVLQTNLVGDMLLGFRQPGTLDPGGNLLTVEAFDDGHRAAQVTVPMTLGPMQSGAAALPTAYGGQYVSGAAYLAASEEVLEELIEANFQPIVADLEDMALEEIYQELEWRTIVWEATSTRCENVDLTIDIDEETYTLGVEGIEFDVELQDDLATIHVTTPQAFIEGRIGGYCRAEWLGICVFKITIDLRVQLEAETPAVFLELTEHDIANNIFGVQPQPDIDPDNVNITVIVDNVKLGCILGWLYDAITFWTKPYEDTLEELANEFVDSLDISELLDQLYLPYVALPLADVRSVDFAAEGVMTELDISGAQINPSGVTAEYRARFSAVTPSPNAPDLSDLPDTEAPAVVTPIPGMTDVSLLVSDDALSGLVAAMVEAGLFDGLIQQEMTIPDLVELACPDPEVEPICRAANDLPCGLDAECLKYRTLLDAMNIFPDTPLRLYALPTVVPSVYLVDAAPGHVDAKLRAQMKFGLGVDRDGAPLFPEDPSLQESCLVDTLNGDSLSQCKLWQECLTITLDLRIYISEGPGFLELTLEATDANFTYTGGCEGAVASPTGESVLENLTETDVVNQVNEAVSQMPPLRFDLTVPGLVSFSNLQPLVIDNAGNANFKEYVGANADATIQAP